MPEERSDYVRRRIAGTLNRVGDRVRRVLFGQEKIEIDGKIRWRRIPVYTPPVVVDPPSPPPPSPPPPPVPSDGVYGRILHDYEFYPKWFSEEDNSYHFVSRPKLLELEGKILKGAAEGLPETVPALDWRMIPMPPVWQWYWFHLLCRANPAWSIDELVNLFRKVTRSNGFKTNKAGAESGYYNAVTGENQGADPIKTGVLLTGGAWVRIVGETSNAYKVAALDMDKNPPSLDDFDTIHQTPTIFFATTSNRANDGALVLPLTGGPNIPCPSVTKGKDYILIAKNRVRLLVDNKPPYPYNLA